MGNMLTLELARRLSDAGLTWKPGSGDRFVVAVSGMEDDVFVISEITVDVHHFTTGDVIGFNGTTEWALDSVEQDKAVWLPGRTSCVTCSVSPSSRSNSSRAGMPCRSRGRDGAVGRHADIDAERAYARAVLAQLETSAPEA